jgi:hypothetical protein
MKLTLTITKADIGSIGEDRPSEPFLLLFAALLRNSSCTEKRWRACSGGRLPADAARRPRRGADRP